MIRTVVVFLAFALSTSIAFSQDAAAKKEATQQHHALKSVSCDPACGFSVRSHDESEIVNIVQMHAKKQHNKQMSEMDVKKMMKEETEEKNEMKGKE